MHQHEYEIQNPRPYTSEKVVYAAMRDGMLVGTSELRIGDTIVAKARVSYQIEAASVHLWIHAGPDFELLPDDEGKVTLGGEPEEPILDQFQKGEHLLSLLAGETVRLRLIGTATA